MEGIAVPAQGIHLPGKGFAPIGWREAAEAVRDYDPTLALGRNDATGEWIVCKERGLEGPPHPVLSLGRSPEPPSREAVTERLYSGDVRRNAARIVASIARHNERMQADKRAAASEAAGEWSEYAEFATRGERG